MSSAKGVPSESTIERAEAWTCRFELPAPVTLGDYVIRQREFVVVRIRTRGGAEGVAYALSRGAPVDLVVTDCLGPVIVGLDALDIPYVSEQCARAMITLGTSGIALRAYSLVDIALWDIKAKLADLPVWRLLGGYRREIPVMLVAPYAMAEESDQDYAVRLGQEAAGFKSLKLYPLKSAKETALRLQAIRDTLGGSMQLVLDMAWSWKSISEAAIAARLWEAIRLTWIEDPFPPDRVDLIGGLRAAISTPIGAGDEVTERRLVDSLLSTRAVDVLRLDATTIGGFSAFASIAERAQSLGCPVSPHIYPEIHQHCAFAWPSVERLEIYPANSPTWLGDRLLRSAADLRLEDGKLEAPDSAGLGLELNWEAVEKYSTRFSQSFA
jgi:L-alanine-DL-glutamate epimerase-like enolase superfamily enzyme